MLMSDIEKLEDSAIDKKIDEARLELFNVKMQKQTMGLEKPHAMKSLKKDVARLLTAKAQRKGKK